MIRLRLLNLLEVGVHDVLFFPFTLRRFALILTGCLLLALAYAMILFYAVGGFARMLDFLR